jgi:hypothetical protein
MKLITKELIERFKKQGDTSEKRAPDITVIAKFFCPWGSATWFATDYDAKDNVCFGFVQLGGSFEDCAELGYFSIEELESLRGPMGLKIERDLYWKERTLKEVMDCKGHL